jgi:hypothetical protein
VGCSPANSRQVYRRATHRLRETRPRFTPDHDNWRLLVERFLAAARDGDLAELERLLADDVVSWSDGGGRAGAARHPVVGGAQVARLVAGLVRKAGDEVVIDVRELNGGPALLAHVAGHLLVAMLPHVVDAKISALRSITNPDKLRFLQHQLAWLSHPKGLSGPH